MEYIHQYTINKHVLPGSDRCCHFTEKDRERFLDKTFQQRPRHTEKIWKKKWLRTDRKKF